MIHTTVQVTFNNPAEPLISNSVEFYNMVYYFLGFLKYTCGSEMQEYWLYLEKEQGQVQVMHAIMITVKKEQISSPSILK
mmetsp:Transcript_1951/g.2219  ORF Transcript_1951/g.2219 Transcript_1951/m.2219 type:complete len:80 (+) Transcript_1951:49-288(+)